MRVFFTSYPSLSLNRGGPTYKVKYLKKAIEKLGVEVVLYDPWDLDLEIKNSKNIIFLRWVKHEDKLLESAYPIPGIWI